MRQLTAKKVSSQDLYVRLKDVVFKLALRMLWLLCATAYCNIL